MDMLEWDPDVLSIIDAARNTRDETLNAVQFDGGFRGGELYDMTIGDISDSDHSIKININQRSVPAFSIFGSSPL